MPIKNRIIILKQSCQDREDDRRVVSLITTLQDRFFSSRGPEKVRRKRTNGRPRSSLPSFLIIHRNEIARGRPAEGRPVDFLRLTVPPVNGQSHESRPYFKVASSRQRTLLRRRLTSARAPKRRHENKKKRKQLRFYTFLKRTRRLAN